MSTKDVQTRDRVVPKLLVGAGIVLLLCGAWVLVAKALPYLEDEHHSTVRCTSREYCEAISGLVYFEFETADAFVANNPIRMSVYARPWDESIERIQLSFEGAYDYFPAEYAEYPSPPYDFGNEESIEQYHQAIDEWWREWEEQSERERQELSRGLIHLQREEDDVGDFARFLPAHAELTYSTGGSFGVGITVTKNDGGVVGYEMGDDRYLVADIIDVSPPEILHTIKNNNLLTGLAWLGVALTIFTIGSAALIAPAARRNIYITREAREPRGPYIGLRELFEGVVALIRALRSR